MPGRCTLLSGYTKPGQNLTKTILTTTVRQLTFLIVGLFFVFSYPYLSNQLNLGTLMGWQACDLQTYLIPFWFVAIAFLYKKLDQTKKIVSSLFFKIHIFSTIIPPFIFNYPFVLLFLKSGNENQILTTYLLIVWLMDLYALIQIVFAAILFIRLVRRHIDK